MRYWQLKAHVSSILLLSGVVWAGVIHADLAWIPNSAGGTNIPAQSLLAQRFSHTIAQQYDFSCGSASLATLLTYQYGDPVSEADVFRSMWAYGDQDKIHQEGFSLLDIKQYLERTGYVANGYEIPVKELFKRELPGIVLINDQGYNHFVVVKGYQNGRVLVGDPAKGARVIPEKEFTELLLNDIVFVITSTPGRAVFNGKNDWAARPLAPLSAPASMQELTNVITLNRPSGDL